MTILGQLTLWLALLLGVWGAVVGYLGGQRGDPALIQSARRTTYALAGLLTVASLALFGCDGSGSIVLMLKVKVRLGPVRVTAMVSTSTRAKDRVTSLSAGVVSV